MLQRIIFEGFTVSDLVRQCKAFIGEQELRLEMARYGTATVMKTWPVPAWAPKGSKWTPGKAPPVLLAPDGREVEVRWVAGTAQRPLRSITTGV